MRRLAKVAAIVLGTLLALAAIVLFVLLDTQFGHEKVGNFAVSQIQNAIHGRLTVPNVEAGLSGATFHDVTLTDAKGRPFLRAKEVHARYDLRHLLHKRIYLSSLELVDPVMVLSRPPGEDWNFKRIFGGGAPPQPNAPPGYGSWVRFRNVTIDNGEIIVKEAWSPPDSLPAATRRKRLTDALAGRTRWRVERAPGGYERIMRFHDVDGRLATLRLANPEHEGIFADVARLNMIAEPYLPPAAHVRNVEGRFWFANDTLRVRDGRLRLPGSVLTGSGMYAVQEQDVRLTGTASPLRLGDVQWVRPSLPDEGTASMHIVLARQGGETRLTATDLDASIEGATAHGRVGIAFGDSLRFHDTDVRFADVRTRLLERLFPGFTAPRQGTLTGTLAMQGQPASLRVTGDVRFADAADGASHVVADGRLAFRGNGVIADGLDVRMQPLQVALARAFAPSLPLAGTLTGTATLNGSTDGRMAMRVDVTHDGEAGVSQVTGDIALTPAGGATRSVDADVAVHPLALATVGRFAPAAGLHGSATGTIRAHGTTGELSLDTDLDFANDGVLHAEGTLDLTGTPGYDIRSQLTGLNLAAVAAHVPATKLTGTATVRGSGTDPATLRAALAADLSGARVEGVGADAAHLRVAVADGLATVDSSTLRLASGRLALDGRFGVAAGRSGTLNFVVDVDSLRDFSRWLPGDTGIVTPRPARMRAIIAKARADSLRIAMATQVERAATGRAPNAKLEYDTIPPLSRDSIAGTLHATGTLKGNVRRFDVAGQARMHDLVIAGNVVGNGQATFTWLGAPSPGGTIGVEAAGDSVRVAGFTLDSVTVRVRQTGLPGHGQPANGTAVVAVRQDTQRNYSVDAEYRIELDSRRVKLNDVMMRFDSLTWHTTRPGAVVWGGSGFELETIEMTNGQGGRIYLDGRLPKVGSADLQIALDSVQIGNIIALLQDSLQAQGLVSLHAKVNGTQAAPQLNGDFRLANAEMGGHGSPDHRRDVRLRRSVAERARSHDPPRAAARHGGWHAADRSGAVGRPAAPARPHRAARRTRRLVTGGSRLPVHQRGLRRERLRLRQHRGARHHPAAGRLRRSSCRRQLDPHRVDGRAAARRAGLPRPARRLAHDRLLHRHGGRQPGQHERRHRPRDAEQAELRPAASLHGRARAQQRARQPARGCRPARRGTVRRGTRDRRCADPGRRLLSARAEAGDGARPERRGGVRRAGHDHCRAARSGTPALSADGEPAPGRGGARGSRYLGP